jgi:hypothetical protein
MTKELKVYGGNYDGRNRYIVAARTKKAAWQAFCDHGVPVSSFTTWNKFTSVSGDYTENKLAIPHPGKVFRNLRGLLANGYEEVK